MENKDHILDLKDYKQIGENLGEGSYGKVIKIENRQTKQIYAAKLLNHNNINPFKEISILKKLKHPGLVKYIGYSDEPFKYNDQSTFIGTTLVIEFLEKGSLGDILTKLKDSTDNIQSEWDLTKKKICLLGIADSMRYLHKIGILHRDLKPYNILLDSNYYPKIIDFGVSRDFEITLTGSKSFKNATIAGSPIYMAPELKKGDKYANYTPSIDVYSFGITAFQIITGLELSGSYDPEYRPKFPPGYNNKKMKALIEACWSSDPHARPSFDQIYHELFTDFTNEYFEDKNCENIFKQEKVNNDKVMEYIKMLNDNKKNLEIVKHNQIDDKHLDKEHQIIIKNLLNQSNIKSLIIENKPIVEYVCEIGDLELVKFLVLAKKIKVEKSHFLSACLSGCIQIVQFLMPFISNFPQNSEDVSEILEKVCRIGSVELFDFLSEKLEHFDLNLKFQNGGTLLHCACSYGQLELVKHLIKLGIDVNSVTDDGLSILYFACCSNNLELVKYLFENYDLSKEPSKDDKFTILHYACRSGNEEIVKYLILDKHEDVNTKSENGTTIFHSACESGNLNLVIYLAHELSKSIKIEIDSETDKKKNALHFACLSGSIEIVKYILSLERKNLNLHSKTSEKLTVLHFAQDSGNKELIRYIKSLLKEQK